MDSKLQSLPKFIRSEPSPKVMDSAFPPFKIEHRYRGVYERAGFDVNLGGNNDTRSLRSPKSNHGAQFPKMMKSPPSNVNSPTVSNHSKFNKKPYIPNYDQSNSQNRSFSEITTPHRILNNSGFNSSNRSLSESSSQPNTSRSTDLFINHSSSGKEEVSPPSSPDSPELSASSKQGRKPPPRDSFNFSPQSNHSASRNVKNLQLNLGAHSNDPDSINITRDEEPFSDGDDFKDTRETSIDQSFGSPQNSNKTNELNAPYPIDNDQNTLNTPSNIGEDPNQKQRLSSLLDDFKKDIEIHKNYQPQPKQNSPVTKSPPLPSMSPSQLGLARFDNSPSNQQDDYQNYLRSQSSPNANNFRNSQISTVSSVISKGSVYDDDDDEIEQELQRQLENLKTNGTSREEIQSDTSNIDDSRSFTLASMSFHNTNVSVPKLVVDDYPTPNDTIHSIPTPMEEETKVPTFTIDDAETAEAKAKKEHQEESELDDLSSNASFESVKPLSVRHSRIKPFDDNELHELKQIDENNYPPLPSNIDPYSVPPKRGVMFDETVTTIETPEVYKNNHQNDQVSPQHSQSLQTSNQLQLPYPTQEYHEQQDETPDMPQLLDFVKPLSPKNHQIQEELSGMNFQMHDMPESPGSDQYDEDIQPLNTKSIDAILASANQSSRPVAPPPSDFEPFPKSNSESPKQDSKRTMYPPGQGPCRICHQTISPMAKGSQKAIYSKTGELSGQWHRSCFTCAYDNCGIKFNKSVQCYALDDNAYCHMHYHELNGTLCDSCHNGIEGECIENELEQKWHLNCLTCEKCNYTISNDYYLINNHIYCEEDAMNIIHGRGSYNGLDGNLKSGGLSTVDKIEKRRTRVLFVD